MNSQILRWEIFLPPSARDQRERATIIEQTLRGLWEHGIRFATSGWDTVTTWDDALAAPATARTVSLGPAAMGLDPEPLRACIARMATARECVISLYGAQASMTLGFDFAVHPQVSAEDAALLTDPLKRAGVNQYWDRMQLQCSTPMGADAVEQAKRAIPNLREIDSTMVTSRAYLASYEEYWRWCTLLCELTSPVYGMGYRDDMLTWRGLEEHAFYYMNGGQELVERRLPDLSALFSREPVRYLAADFPHETQRHVIEEARQSSRIAPVIQPLSTGGTLVRPGHPVFTPEAERAFTLMLQSYLLMDHLEALGPQLAASATDEDVQNAARTTSPATRAEGQALAEQTRDRLQRARELFLDVGDTTDAERAKQSLHRVQWAEERLGVQPT